MRTWAVVALTLGLGCGRKDAAPEEPSATAPLLPGAPQDPEQVVDPDAPAQPSVFPDGTRSLELTKTVGVRLEPGDTAKRIGNIAINTRVAWTRTADARGCRRPWVEIAPRGWICSDYVRPSKRLPLGREVPMLGRGELVPGVYGKVTAPNSVIYVVDKAKPAPRRRARKPPAAPAPTAPAIKLVEGPPLVGSVTVRQYGELTVDRKTFWKVSQRDAEYVLARAIKLHRPSTYAGARLGDETGRSVPIGFVMPRVASWGQAYTTYKPIGGGVVRRLPSRTAIAILDTEVDKAGKPRAYRIGDAEWIAAADARVFHPAPPPPLLRPGERWIDVDLDSQILVAFEGDLAVYATLVSSGGKDTPTQLGTYRMWLKESEADMKGLNGEDPYSVATVPWTQFFSSEKGLALHTAYWHDGFGAPRSHGCVNLAPRDARWLYFWSDPQVPPGWTMAAGVPEAPGSVVRIRDHDNPQPPWREYALKVQQQREREGPLRL